jgi:hypothetical protein
MLNFCQKSGRIKISFLMEEDPIWFQGQHAS